MNKALKIAYLKLHPGTNISVKLTEILIDAFVVFFHLLEPFQESFYEITFGHLC